MRLAQGARAYRSVIGGVLAAFATIMILLPLTGGCQTGVSGNDGGSVPVNKEEELDYKKAVNRCYKTGGTRVVKIMGQLRCY